MSDVDRKTKGRELKPEFGETQRVSEALAIVDVW